MMISNHSRLFTNDPYYLLYYFIALFVLNFLPVYSSLYGQNLIPDGGFEIVIDGECERPDQGFKRMKLWYLLDATPDFFEGTCNFDENDFVFWNDELTPFEGSNYAGIWSRWNSNGTYFTEGIAIELTRPLVEGQTYFFQMAIFNQGSFQGLDDSFSGCSLNPEKHIDLYVSEDSIRVVNNFAFGSASTSADMVATLDSEEIKGDGSEEWTLVSTCFEAKGGESFFALIMPLGTFGELPPCTETMASSGVFRSFYYHIDDLELTQLPLELTKEIQACADRPLEIRLLDEFDFPLLESAEFYWDDGIVGEFRVLDQIRAQTVIAELDCGSISLHLDIEPLECLNNVYLSNIFSPNGDGINDFFMASFAENLNLSHFRFLIYDKWGIVVFESNNPIDSWDGKKGGQNMLTGTYGWFLSYGLLDFPEEDNIIKQGTVDLVR